MTKIYIKTEQKEVKLDEELNSYGLGEYYAVEIESVEYNNDFGGGKLFTWREPDIDNKMIFNDYQAVMIGQMFDIKGNLYEVVWTKKDDYVAEDMELEDFTVWESPFSVELIE